MFLSLLLNKIQHSQIWSVLGPKMILGKFGKSDHAQKHKTLKNTAFLS